MPTYRGLSAVSRDYLDTGQAAVSQHRSNDFCLNLMAVPSEDKGLGEGFTPKDRFLMIKERSC